eukprot:TCONS_00013482-protein
MVASNNVDNSVVEEMMDQLRKDNNIAVDNLERKRQQQLNELQNKLAARRQRRQQEAKRKGQEEAAQKILEEQSHLAINSKPTTAEHIVIPNVVAGQSPEEQALKREQERTLEELQERQQEEMERLEDKLAREAKDNEHKEIQDFEAYRERTLREAKNRQAAELSARSDLSAAATQQLLASHQAQLENLMESLDGDRMKQHQALQQKLADKRRMRQEAMKTKHDSEMAKELLEQKKELADAERNALKEAEREAMLDAIRENGAEATEYIVKKILEQRQAKELADLEKMYGEERKVVLDGLLSDLTNKHINEKDELRAKQEQQIKDLQNEDLSPDERQQRRGQLFNEQQLEMSQLERKQLAEKKALQKDALSDWELRYAQAKLELKEKHYKEYADYLSDLSPEQATDHNSSIRQAQDAARELEEVREKLEEQKHENEARLKKEMEAFEAAEAERLQQELTAHEAALEREAEDERKKNDKAILALNTRKEALLKEKKTKAKQEISKLIQQGASKEEQDALLKEHSKDLAKLMNKMDADRMRMQSQLENRLKKKRDERRHSKLKELERKSEEAKEDFKEQLDSEKDKLKSDATMILKETINVDNLVQSSMPEPDTPAAPEQPVEEMPASFLMTAPMSDNELVNLLMQSPLYQKLQNIRDRMNGVEPKTSKDQKEEDSYIDERDDTLFSSDEKLSPVDLDELNAREFVIYKFSCFIRDLLGVHCFHKPVHILLADKLPPNSTLSHNAYRNSFYYDPNNRLLYLRRDRLENVGEFILVLVHTLCHTHVDDMRSDSDPKFVKEFYKALSVVCSDLFLSRYRRSNAMNEAFVNFTDDQNMSVQDAGKRVLETVFGDTHDEMERSNVVNDLLDTKLVRNKHNTSQKFDRDVMFKRLRKYTDFIVSNKLRNFLGDVEEKLTDTKNQGSESQVDQRLKELKFQVKDQRPVSRYVPSNNREMSREIAKQNTRNLALARSPLALSFVPPRPTTSRPKTGQRPMTSGVIENQEKDFYETFLEAQVDELKDKIDELDLEFTTLTRQSLELSTQVKNLESEVAGYVDAARNSSTPSEMERMSEIVRSSNDKLSSARSQFTQAMIAKSERLKRLEAYRKELEERENLLSQHQKMPAADREERADRKLKSAMAKTK